MKEKGDIVKNKKKYLILLILIFYFGLLTQLNTILFNKSDDNNVKIIGRNLLSNSHLICEWNRTWGRSYWDISEGVAVDSLDNIYITGSTYNFGTGDYNMVLVKYDNSGVQIWNRTWGGNDDEEGLDLVVDSSDNIYLIGYKYYYGTGYSDIILVKYDNSGTELWNRTWDGSDEEVGLDIIVDSYDNVYLVGYTLNYGTGYYDMVLVKYNSPGVELWNCTWGGFGYHRGWAIAVDSSDNIYITGITNNYGVGYEDIILLKCDDSGVELWNRTWGGSAWDSGWGVIVDSSNNIYITGITTSFGAENGNIILLKYDSSGVLQWNRTWGGNNGDYGFGVDVDFSDNIYITGATSSFGAEYNDIILLKYNNSGVLQWNRTWGGNDEDSGLGVTVDSSDNVYLTGQTYSYGAGGSDMVLLKYIPDIYEPLININNPLTNQVFGDIAPDYDIWVIEPNLDSIWYTIDGGITNYTINYYFGKINQTAWDAAPSGKLNLRFYAKDLAGNVGYSEVNIEKRIIISGFSLVLFISAISMITVIYLKKKYK